MTYYSYVLLSSHITIKSALVLFVLSNPLFFFTSSPRFYCRS